MVRSIHDVLPFHSQTTRWKSATASIPMSYTSFDQPMTANTSKATGMVHRPVKSVPSLLPLSPPRGDFLPDVAEPPAAAAAADGGTAAVATAVAVVEEAAAPLATGEAAPVTAAAVNGTSVPARDNPT